MFNKKEQSKTYPLRTLNLFGPPRTEQRYSPSLGIRIHEAQSQVTTSTSLSSLARSPEEDVRVSVASNLNTSATTLRMLSIEDKSPYVRREVAQNPNTPFVVLFELTFDEYEDVAASARYNLSLNHPATPDREDFTDGLYVRTYEPIGSGLVRRFAERVLSAVVVVTVFSIAFIGTAYLSS